MDQFISHQLSSFWRESLAIVKSCLTQVSEVRWGNFSGFNNCDFSNGSLSQCKSQINWNNLIAVFAFVGLLLPATLSAQVSREYAIKSAYMYNFGTYVKWPKEAFQNANAPFDICVVGDAPVQAYINRFIAAGKLIDGRKIRFTQVKQAADIPADCHMIYLSKDLAANEKNAAAAKLKGKPTLILSDDQAFAQQGGGIRFTFVAGKIRLEIAPNSIKERKLKVDARLLQVGTVVKE